MSKYFSIWFLSVYVRIVSINCKLHCSSVSFLLTLLQQQTSGLLAGPHSLDLFPSPCTDVDVNKTDSNFVPP